MEELDESSADGEATNNRLRRQGGGQMNLGAVPLTSASGRTLLDIIRDEGTSSGSGVSWKGFKDHMRLRRAGAAWAESSGQPSLALGSRPILARTLSVRGPPLDPSSRGAIDSKYGSHEAAASMGEEKEGAALRVLGEQQQQKGERPVTMSLMALLEQADRESGYTAAAAEEEEEMEVEEGKEEKYEEEKSGEGRYVCCVCMVRHKRAAVVPCGHTFCRMCSRELWVSPGECPLCNGFILEILNIF